MPQRTLEFLLRTRKQGTGAKDTERELKAVDKAAGLASKGSKLLQGAALGAGFAMANMALDAAKAIPEMVGMGIEIGRAETALIAYTGSSTLAEDATRKMIEASDDTLTSFEAQQNASQLFAMGLATTGDEAAKLTEVAITLGASMGKGPTQAFEEFALLLANQSIPRLDTFGISSGRVRQRILELQQETEGLSREMAFTQAVMEDAEGKLIDLEAAGFTAGTSVDRLGTQFRQLKEDVALALADAVLPFLDAQEEVSDSAEDQARQVALNSSSFEDYADKIGGVFFLTEDYHRELWAGVIAQNAYEESLEMSESAVDGWAEATEQAELAADGFTESTDEAVLSLIDFSEKSLARAAIKALKEALDAELITSEQYNENLIALQTNLGGMSQESVDASIAVQNIIQDFKDGKINADEMREAVTKLGLGLSKLPKNLPITITIKSKYEGDPQFIPEGIGLQHGGSFTVPPGFPNDSFRLGVSSGEHVNVTPANQTTNNFNMTVNSSAATEPIISDFRFMQQLGST